MSVSSDPLLFNLSSPATPETLAALQTSVAAAIAGGERHALIGLDALGTLDVAVISALIRLLRDAREGGASVSLAATRENIRETLRITGLDQVFAVVAGPQSAPQPRAARPPSKRRVRRAAALFGAVVLLGAFGAMSGSTSAGPESASDVIGSVIAQDGRVGSYRAHVSVDFQLRSFPYVAQHLDGTTYYKRPDNFEIVFDRVPSYAKGFDKIYADIGDPSSWNRRFALSFAGQRHLEGHDDVVVRLVQLVRGMIDHEDVAIDPVRSHIDAMEWHYYNGGTIEMTQQYQKVGTYDVLAAQHATIRIPFVHAAADASYTSYQTNVAIDDTVFTPGSHK